VSGSPEKLRTREGRAFLQALELPADARERIEVALTMIDTIEAQIAPLERELRQLARRQTGCRALMGLYGMGELTSLVTLCELGDVGRLSASRKAVRMAGIDIGVHRSDRRAWGASSPAKALRSCAGRSMRPRWRPAGPAAPTTPTTSR
jgi:transposase